MGDKSYGLEDLETLEGLTEVVLSANTSWTLKGGYRPRGDDVSESFETGPNGLTLGELVGVVAKIYARHARLRPTIKWEDDEGEKGEVPFWADHRFFERIDIDLKSRTVTVGLGS